MPTALETQPQPRATRPIYPKKVPAAVWERVHLYAIRSGMRLTDYLVCVLAAAEPLGGSPRADPTPTPSPLSSTASGGG
ncbi:MAG: hypothetical protein KF873_23585 [Gemmataceae bacterium]|nr:hypothetical protein [Gemmataceae bacterium]